MCLSYGLILSFYHLQDDNFFALLKFKAKLNVTQNIDFASSMVKKLRGKSRKCWYPAFSPIPAMFSKGLFLRCVRSRHYVAKGRGCRLLHFGSPLKPLSNDKILDSSELKEVADDNFKFDDNGRKLSKRVENTVGKGEIARDEQFLLFPNCFQKACFPEASKGVIV